jgi:hypothetical protein
MPTGSLSEHRKTRIPILALILVRLLVSQPSVAYKKMFCTISRGPLQLASAPGGVERLFGQQLTPGAAPFDVAVHQSGLETIMEFEPAEKQEASALATLRTVLNRLERHVTQETFVLTRSGRCVG